MGILHSIEALAKGSVSGLQATQRDWSPYAGHFTSYRAMRELKDAVSKGERPSTIASMLADADQRSLEVVNIIASTGMIKANSPSKKDGVPPCVCFSECTLPGLLSLCERYGRFGLIFEKKILYGAGARPCIYASRDDYHTLAKIGRKADPEPSEQRLFGLSNVYSPPGFGQIQDYTHEREWRLFQDLDLSTMKPLMYVCPSWAISELRSLLGGESIYIPVDIMFSWGA